MATGASGGSESGRRVYSGKSFATERDMVLHLLDDFRCTEAFGAEDLPLWLASSDQDVVKGALRVVGQRERAGNDPMGHGDLPDTESGGGVTGI